MDKKGSFNPTWTGQSSAPKKQTFGEFIWNSETNEFLGRTAFSWFRITVFYIIFYACLAAFFYSALRVFMILNLDDDHPKYTLGDSLISNNPGVGFRPQPDKESSAESTLIWINRNAELTSSPWADELHKFIKEYENSTGGHVCTHEDPAAAGKYCIVNVNELKECSLANNYGYTAGKGSVKPCVLIKLNKIYDWTPQPYMTQKDLNEALGNDNKIKMPKYLQDHITKLINEDAQDELKTIWFTCEGENPADLESIGEVKYSAPGSLTQDFAGIPSYFFPFLNQQGYQSPFVFAQFQNLSDHLLINVRCKAWAKNIVHNTQDMKGLVHFEFLID